MPLLRYENKLIFFVHIPKTGGTSIEDALKAAGVKTALLYGSRFQGFMKTTFQHINAEIYEKTIPAGFYDYSFAIVRHPFMRLVSEYFYRRKRGFGKHNFDTWVERGIENCIKNPYLMDNHFRPQSDFVRPHVEVFKLENGLDKPLSAAAGQLGVTLKTEEPHANKRNVQKPVYWTAKTRDKALAFYKKDFAAFEYDSNQDFPDLRIKDPD